MTLPKSYEFYEQLFRNDALNALENNNYTCAIKSLQVANMFQAMQQINAKTMLGGFFDVKDAIHHDLTLMDAGEEKIFTDFYKD